MLSGDLDFTSLKNVHYFIGAFNGNRFFTDNNRQTNYMMRVRKLFDRPKLAVGFSAQSGKQILPPGVSGDNDENLIGMDFQYVIGRFGLRGEIVAGNTPSTLLGIEPEFARRFSSWREIGGRRTVCDLAIDRTRSRLRALRPIQPRSGQRLQRARIQLRLSALSRRDDADRF